MVDDSAWVSMSEAARRLGVTRSAIRNRIRRGTIKHQTDNHGRPMVLVAVPVPGTVPVGPYRDGPQGTVTGTVPPCGSAERATSEPETVPLSMHREVVASLQAALSEERQRHEAEIERLVGQVHAERTFWIERADAAEVRAERAEERLYRPWWRWWRSIGGFFAPASDTGGSHIGVHQRLR